MRFLPVLFLLLLLNSNYLSAKGPVAKEQRVLFLFDGSLAMQQSWTDGSQTRYQVATDIVHRLVDSVYKINSDVAFGLRVYGHQYPAAQNNCYDSRSEVMFSKDNRYQLALRLENLHPAGAAALSYALSEAIANDFASLQSYDYTIILITGSDTLCSGTVCNIAQGLSYKLTNRPFVLNLAKSPALKEDYACIGNVLQLDNEAAIQAAIDTIASMYRRGPRTDWMDSAPVLVKRPDTIVKKQEIVVRQDTIVKRIVPPPAPPVTTDTVLPGSYLLFTSSLPIKDITLFYQAGDTDYVPTNKVFTLPMPRKVGMNTGRYRVIYYIDTKGGGLVKRTKEFFIRKDLDNKVDLD